jgi:hypothetical protein
MNIDWTPPEPRRGLLGEWDKFVGPGQTRAEFWLILIPSVVATLALAGYARLQGLNWNLVQTIVAMLLAFDLMGGVITNATSTAKRWYHRDGQGTVQHIGFIAVHAVHIFLVAWLFRGMDWLYFGVFYSCLLAASLIILSVPLYLQRPVAFLLYGGVVLISFYRFSPTPGFEWFVPVFFMKLLLSHLLKEAPYRPG